LKGKSFASVVEQSAEQQATMFDLGQHGEHRENLEELLDEVHQRGQTLADSQSLENIKRYRQAVSEFLSYVVDNMLTVEEQTSGGNILRRKRFTQVKIIDRKLESLLQGVLQNQVKQLDLLERINEIRGLLVDLVT
jgi:hypothetical protein